MGINTSNLIITHVEIRSLHPVTKVHEHLLTTLPRLEPALATALRAGDAEAVARFRRDGPQLWLFEVRDMGSMLAAEGRSEAVFQYEIGNPLTAESMVRFQAGAGLYAPLRVLLYTKGSGSVFAYDRPSDLFGQFGDDRVTAVGHDLDRDLQTALSHALEFDSDG